MAFTNVCFFFLVVAEQVSRKQEVRKKIFYLFTPIIF